MKKYTLTVVAAAMLSLSSGFVSAEVLIGDQLASTLPTLSESQNVMAIVTYNQMDPLTEAQLQQILSLGISQGVQFKSLPIVGVVANKQQIEQLSQFNNVLSIFANRQLQYFNADARQIAGVADLQGTDFEQRNGIQYTGKGVTIMVNDSGVDASHQDILFGDTVVENIQALMHASAISITGMSDGITLSNQVNTDTNSGHGTHVAGAIAGNGAMSNGKYVGAAPDADLIGYGSGSGLFLLDTIGGFDFAINNVYSYDSPIKIISNSWGSSGKYEPKGPVSMATYKAHKLGILSVFAAGNSGSGEDTNNPYSQIPWGLSVGAGDKFGKLADFSSRGLKSENGVFTMPDGSTWEYHNEVSIVAPGVDIITTRATTNAAANGGEANMDAIETDYAPFYSMISGTSVATPHVSGIIALMLEANPNLDNQAIKRILQETATNMPGYERWEVGAGYVNARSAVAAALNYDNNHRTTMNNLTDKTINANANLSAVELDEPGVPEFFDVQKGFEVSDGYDGLDDVAGHPQQGAIEIALSERLTNGLSNKNFSPNNVLRRKDFARYAMMGGAIRQHRNLLNGQPNKLSGMSTLDKPFRESVTVTGSALKGFVVDNRGQQLVLADQESIEDMMKGYVQPAITLSLVNVTFGSDQAPSNLEPTLAVHFEPSLTVTRAHYAGLAKRLHLHDYI